MYQLERTNPKETVINICNWDFLLPEKCFAVAKKKPIKRSLFISSSHLNVE